MAKRANPKGREVNAGKIAALFGVTTRTVGNWRIRGCPIVRKDANEVIYNTFEVSQWITDQAVSSVVGNAKAEDGKEELEKRKLAAEASLQELKLQKERGEVVSIDEVIKRVSDNYVSLKSSLRIIPQRIAPMIIGIDDELEVKTLLQDEIDAALGELSNEYVGIDEDIHSEIE